MLKQLRHATNLMSEQLESNCNKFTDHKADKSNYLAEKRTTKIPRSLSGTSRTTNGIPTT